MDYYKKQLEEENERTLKAIERRRTERRKRKEKRLAMIDNIIAVIGCIAIASIIGLMYMLIMAGYTGLIEIF